MVTKKKIIRLLPYLVLIIVIVLPWFLRAGYLFFTDMTWGPNMDLPSWTSRGIYFSLLIEGLSFIIPNSLLEKLFITAVLGIILFGGYKIAQSLTSNKLILFLGSAFGLFNPFVYDRLMYGQIGIILSYGLFLVFVGYLLEFYFCLKKKKLFLSTVFGGLCILFAPHFVFFVGVLYLVFVGLILVQAKSKQDLLRFGKCFVLAGLIVVLLNFNWLLGVVLGDSGMGATVKEEISAQDLEAFKTRGDTPLEVVENVFLMSGFWGMEQFRYESLKNIRENWGRSFYFLLPIIILGLIYNLRDREKRKLSFGLTFIFILACLLALGVALPLTSKITLWLFNHLPFYKGLREPQKWVAVMVAVYEILLVCGLVGLAKKKKILQNKELAAVLMTFIILLQTPLIIWGGAGQIRPFEYPQDWSEVDNLIIEETNCQSKILFLPWHLYMSFKWIGSIVSNPSAKFFECPVIHGKNVEFGGIFGHSPNEDEREVERWVFSFGRTNLLQENKLNIGYIILAKEVDWHSYLWIENHPNVEFIKETENLKVYKIKKYEGQEEN